MTGRKHELTFLSFSPLASGDKNTHLAEVEKLKGKIGNTWLGTCALSLSVGTGFCKYTLSSEVSTLAISGRPDGQLLLQLTLLVISGHLTC